MSCEPNYTCRCNGEYVHPDASMAYKHVRGDINCEVCWGNGFPCKCPCGGLIHADFGDENYDMDYWLYYKCDKCGSTDAPERY